MLSHAELRIRVSHEGFSLTQAEIDKAHGLDGLAPHPHPNAPHPQEPPRTPSSTHPTPLALRTHPVLFPAGMMTLEMHSAATMIVWLRLLQTMVESKKANEAAFFLNLKLKVACAKETERQSSPSPRP